MYEVQAMISVPLTMTIPLRTDADGVIRVGDTRVTLITIVQRYRSGDTPEEIHAGFPTISLGDIYAVIAYYISHQTEVDSYITQAVARAEQDRQAHEAADPTAAAFNDRMRAIRDKQTHR